jgi:preprotein translocase subunit SecE
MKSRTRQTVQSTMLVFNMVVLALIIFLAGFYLGNKNSFLFESNKRGEIIIMRK